MIKLHAAIVDKNTNSLLLENRNLINFKTDDLYAPFRLQLEAHLQRLFGPKLFSQDDPLFLQTHDSLNFIYYMFGCPILYETVIDDKTYDFVPLGLLDIERVGYCRPLQRFLEFQIRGK